MRKICLLLLLILIVYSSEGQPRKVINFNDNWSFILDDNQQYGQPGYSDKSWRVLNVPHDWSIEGKYDKSNPSGPMGGYMPCGTAWYRKHFDLPKETAGKRFYIRFDGVFMKSQVWINGRMVGEYPNGYNSFEYDITPFVKHDAENVLAVRVDNGLQPASRWYTGSGIYRDVNLIVTDQLHFEQDGTFVTTPLVSRQKAVVHVDYRIICNNYPETRFAWTDNTSLFVWTQDENNPSKPKESKENNRVEKECTLTSVLYDGQGKEVERKVSKHQIGDFSDHLFTQEITLQNPKLWSPDVPNLYKLVSTIAYDGEVRDIITNPVGIREFKYSAQNGMTINGEPIKIQGVCVHQNVGGLGSAVPTGLWRERLTMLKAMGCNAIRTHYPLEPKFHDLCDTLGILVSKEILDEWNRGQEWGYTESSYGKLAYTYHLYFEQWSETDQRRMIRRDRNHPSVFMYQLGNEIPNQRIKGIDIARKLREITREEDPTRPTTAACDFFVGANIYGFMDQLDIAGYNYIDRIHSDSLYAAEQSRYPNRILLGTETYHKTRNHVSVRDTPSCIGEFVWVGYDYIGEVVWPDYRGWDAGILDIAGFPKGEYFLRKSYWSEEPVVHIAVEQPKKHSNDWSPRSVVNHWNWSEKTTKPVYVYTNCDEIELILNKRSLGRKKVDPNKYFAYWDVKYKPGTLEAIGFKSGKEVSRNVINTSQTPKSLKIDRVSNDLGLKRFEINVVDINGNKVPDQDVEIIVEGQNVDIVGTDNGNQYDPKGVKYASKNKCMTFEGRMVIYARDFVEGKSQIKVSSDGLEGVIVDK